MAIKLKCPNATCGRPLTVPDSAAGKNGKCPACGAIVKVPRPAPVPPAPPKTAAPNIDDEPGILPMDHEPPPVVASKPKAKPEAPPPEVKAVRQKPPAPPPTRRPPVVADVEELEVVEPGDEEEPPSDRRARARPKPQPADDDLEVVEDDDDRDDRPRRKSRPKKPRDLDDDIDDLEDDEDSLPRRRRPRPGRRQTSISDPTLVPCLAAGIVALILIVVAPFLSWLHVSASMTVNGATQTMNMDDAQKTAAGGGAPGMPKTSLINGWEGKVMLGVSVLLAILIGVSLLLWFTGGPDVAELMAAISGSLAAGWGIACMLWVIGIMWKVYAVSAKMNSAMDKAKSLLGRGGMPGLPKVESSFSMFPSIGAWLALLASIVVIALFCAVVMRRRQPIWLAIGAAAGAIAGILLLTLNAKPWDTGPDLPF